MTESFQGQPIVLLHTPPRPEFYLRGSRGMPLQVTLSPLMRPHCNNGVASGEHYNTPFRGLSTLLFGCWTQTTARDLSPARRHGEAVNSKHMVAQLGERTPVHRCSQAPRFLVFGWWICSATSMVHFLHCKYNTLILFTCLSLK